jgi:hypothetical protein
MNKTRSVPGFLFLASAFIVNQGYAGTAFSPSDQPLGHIGPIELNTTDLSVGAKAYRGWFENGSWQGDLIEYDVSNVGVLTTSVDLTSTSPAQGGTATNWSAHIQFVTNTATTSHWNTGRKIITNDGTSQAAFRWSKLSAAQQQAIDLDAYNNSATSSDTLDFLRGDRSNENPAGAFRLRFSVLGDIIHSNPEHVSVPDSSIVGSSYTTFKNANLTRSPRVYVGSNDGMLHAFDADTGDEVWAYVPALVMDNLSKLAGIPYSHQYYVDGGITVHDGYFEDAGDWHSVLVGSLGAGGKGLYALDVTDPGLSSELLSSGGDSKFLWELSADGDDDIGFIFDSTTITLLNDGNWYAINGNGFSSVNGIAKLFLINLETGATTVLSTGSGSTGSPNGLAAPALVDTDNDGKADLAFAGDIDGDMWRFDLNSTSAGDWDVDYKLFDGSSTQPITLAPDVTNHPQQGHIILFGTGRLFTSDDITDTSTQAIYGIQDKGTAPGTPSLLTQILSADSFYSGGGFSETVRTFTTTAAIDWSTSTGWQVELPAGERLLTQPILRSGRLKTTITNPDGYTNWLMEVTFDEGGADNDSIFDLDRNSLLNNDDRIDNNTDSDLLDLEDIPMAWERPRGNMSQVTIGSLAAGVDTLFLNFLNPALVPPACSGSCAGGLTGGHMDVDTDSSSLGDGLGGGTDGHEHEYDDKTNRTFVDYFDIDPLGSGKLKNVNGVGIANNENFIVLVANADMSPGGELTINTKKYSVVTYQRMIHKVLAGWNGFGPLVDDDGDTLIHSLNSISAAGGGLKSTFDSLAIISGGLHPTQTGCVNKTSSLTNGRWRNGSLIFQLIKASHFAGLGGSSALDRVTVQNPTDLKTVVTLSDGTQVNLTEDLNTNSVIDTSSPNYEAYGGLYANNNSEFLYESTLFWHFGDVSKMVLGVKPCYGDTDWEAAFVLETQGVSKEVFDDILNDAGYADFDALIDALALLEDCKAIKGKKGCKKEYKKLLELYTLGQLVENSSGGGSGSGSGSGGGGITGTPLVIEGGVSEGGKTSGPNFESGRRTWIDILSE